MVNRMEFRLGNPLVSLSETERRKVTWKESYLGELLCVGSMESDWEKRKEKSWEKKKEFGWVKCWVSEKETLREIEKDPSKGPREENS